MENRIDKYNNRLIKQKTNQTKQKNMDTIVEKSEKIKGSIKAAGEKSKETIRELIAQNHQHVTNALDSNKKIVSSIKEKFTQQEMDETITDTLKTSFGKSVELAEDTLDSIINSYTRQMEMNVDFNTQLVEVVKERGAKQPEKMLELIHDNFEKSRQMTINNTKEILDFYHKHTNLAVNFNRKFSEGINAQLEQLFSIQNKGLNRFTGWASEWWKQDNAKKA
ncbi:MAG: hypothetical protein ACYDCN_16765 [Bacteroidia bacterium]